jgi:hypothetical protein
VQMYGGELFGRIRDSVDATFMKLPPPTPSLRRYGSSSATTPINMQQFNNRNGPCFAPHCMVLLADGTEKRVDQIHQGDVVSGNGTVLCIVETVCRSKTTEMCQFSSGLQITPSHPILAVNIWHFPRDFVRPSMVEVDSVYSFVSTCVFLCQMVLFVFCIHSVLIPYHDWIAGIGPRSPHYYY